MAGARTLNVAGARGIPAARTAAVDRDIRLQRTACGAAVALAIVAPFEALRPVVTLPGQALTTVEATLVAVMLLVAATLVAARRWPLRESPDFHNLLAGVVFVAVAAWAALTAPADRANALHMAARFAMALAVWGVVVIGGRTKAARHLIAAAVVSTAIAVSALVIADFADVTAVRAALQMFRANVADVGGQVRASGPFQYPTIASMYLELAFALGLGLLAQWPDIAWWPRQLLVAALALIFEAVVLTFTRSGLISAWVSLAAIAAILWRRRGIDKTTGALATLAVLMTAQLLLSQPGELLRLRLTSEGQTSWFRAAIDAPAALELDTRRVADVMVTVTNTGRATWDSYGADPIRLSYHWVADDSDVVVAWEGLRTPFSRPVPPGETVMVRAQVKSPNRPGRFRLMWDLEQRQRRWFSTEPDATSVFSQALVAGPAVADATPEGRVPARVPSAVQRPGRRLLWGAALRMWWEQPWFGVGPDNFRLHYGRYSSLVVADTRVHSNNMYIEVLAGMGLVGAAAMGLVGVRLARSAVAAARTDGLGVGVAAACTACTLHGLADSFLAFTGTYVVMAIVAGLACAYQPDGVGHAHRI